MKAVLCAALLVSVVLAGCADTSERDEMLRPQSSKVPHFDGYTWHPPVVLANASDAPAHALAADGVRPHYVQQMVDGGGAEPNIGINPRTGSIFVTTFDQVRRSTDGGGSWEIVHDFDNPFTPMQRDEMPTSDPMLWVDPDTGRVFVIQMSPGTTCFYLAFSDDDGESWSDDQPVSVRPGHASCNSPYVDHPKITTGPPGPATNDVQEALLTAGGYPNVVYTCVNKVANVFGFVMVLGSWCMVSFDGGVNWAYETRAIEPEEPPIPNTQTCATVNGHPAVHPDGTVVLPAGHLGGVASSCVKPVIVSVSEDNGLSWRPSRCPMEQCGRLTSIDPDITFTPDGTGYIVYRSDDNRTYLARSTDKFATWEGPWAITPEDHTLNVFQAVTSGDDGRLAIAFLGTRQEQEWMGESIDSSAAAAGTHWHAFMATTHDADAETPSFVVEQVTPDEDPVQVGCVWIRGGGPCRNLLDFIDAVRDADGRAYVAITDGCVPRNGCTMDPDSSNGQSGDRHIAVIVQDSGASLLADKGVLASLGLQHPPRMPPEAQAEAGA